MARRVDDAATVAFTLVQRAAALRSTDHLVRRRADLKELVELSRELGDPITEVLTVQRLAEIAFESANYDEVIESIERSERLIDGLRGASRSHLELRVMRNRAELAMLRGEVDQSVAQLESMMDLADKLGLTRQSIAGYMGSITKARSAQGRIAETIPLWRQLSEGFGDIFLPGLGAVLLESGQPDEAESIYRRYADEHFVTVSRDLTWLHNLAFLTVLCERFGTAAEAAELEALLAPHADLLAYGGAGCYGSVAHFLGTLALVQGDVERADWWLDKAVQINAAMHAPLLQAATLVSRAVLLETRDHGSDRERAQQLRAEAVSLALQCGAPAIAARARRGPLPDRTSAEA
jgi:tetratricopeptide (TPR) repeat protein